MIYDHRSNKSPEKAHIQQQTTTGLNDILANKRNTLKHSGVSSLSSLLALDDQRMAMNLLSTGVNPMDISGRSNTLPLKSNSNSSLTHSPARCPIYKVNFNEPAPSAGENETGF